MNAYLPSSSGPFLGLRSSISTWISYRTSSNILLNGTWRFVWGNLNFLDLPFEAISSSARQERFAASHP